MLGQQIEPGDCEKRDQDDLSARPTGTGAALSVRAVVHVVLPAVFQRKAIGPATPIPVQTEHQNRCAVVDLDQRSGVSQLECGTRCAAEKEA